MPTLYRMVVTREDALWRERAECLIESFVLDSSYMNRTNLIRHRAAKLVGQIAQVWLPADPPEGTWECELSALCWQDDKDRLSLRRIHVARATEDFGVGGTWAHVKVAMAHAAGILYTRQQQDLEARSRAV